MDPSVTVCPDAFEKTVDNRYVFVLDFWSCSNRVLLMKLVRVSSWVCKLIIYIEIDSGQWPLLNLLGIILEVIVPL